MKTYLHFPFALILALAVLSTPAHVDAKEGKKKKMTKVKTKKEFSPNQFIVKWKNMDDSLITQMHHKHKVKHTRRLIFKNIKDHHIAKRMEEQQLQLNTFPKVFHKKGKKARNLSHIFVVEVESDQNIEEIVNEYAKDENVEFAQLDYKVEVKVSMDDPLYSSLWAMSMVEAEHAWDINQGEGSVVAVVDTGVDVNHEDLQSNIWFNTAETLNGLDDDNNGFIDDINGWNFNGGNNSVLDGNSHGTHVAGTIAAIGNNGLGVVGLAPKAKIMAVKGLSDSGSGFSSHLASGIIYAAMNGADVINNSWGCSSACPSNPIVENAVRTAHDLGAVVVFSAGNNADDAGLYSPGHMKETITVAASGTSDTRASYSNTGVVLNVSAPGNSILSTTPGDQYGSKSGTSMAAPHVSALAALVKSHFPSLSGQEVQQVLQSSSDDIESQGFDLKSGHGRINALAALQMNSVVHTEITSPTYNEVITSKTLGIHGTVSGEDFSEYSIFYKPADDQSAWVLSEGPFHSEVTNAQLGNIYLDGLNDGLYLANVSSLDIHGNEFNAIVQFEVEAGEEEPPCEQQAPTLLINNDHYSVLSGTSVTVEGTLMNNNDTHCESSTYNLISELPNGWSTTFSPSNSLTLSSSSSTAFSILLQSPADAQGGEQHQITITAMDADIPGLNSSDTFNVSVTSDTERPTINIISPTDGQKLKKGRIKIEAEATDDQAVDHVVFRFGNGTVIKDYTFPYNTVWNARKFPVGTYTIEAYSVDSFGNTSDTHSIQVELISGSKKGKKGRRSFYKMRKYFRFYR